MKKPNVWIIFPTRGGSTGLPEKNIKEIAGQPLLFYMTKRAVESTVASKVFLTTDSEDIASIAKQVKGLEVLRHDPHLSFQGRPSFGVFQYTVKKLLESSVEKPDSVVMMRVTTPLCLTSDIDAVITLFLENKNKVDSVLSVTKSDIHPHRTYKITENNLLSSWQEGPETNYPLPRQVFGDVYIRNGAIYATSPEIVLGGSLWGECPMAYIMPKSRSININDDLDFILAQELLKIQNENP